LDSLTGDWAMLWEAALLTGKITIMALALAVAGGAGLAILFNQSKLLELSLYPYAVILQVTPVVSIAPLIFIYVESKTAGMLLCAWIVAFFPVLSSTTLGLNSVDHNLRDLFRIYGASRWQKLWLLQLPSALPYFLGGLKIAGGLSLIGAVVAELVAGTGGVGAGLAARIQEAGYRLNIARMFAALSMIAAMGVVIFAALSLLAHLLLRKWHDSAIKRET
jgi:NitT/TauT family transport system permease protein